MCPTKSKEIKTFVMDKFHKRTWEKELGRKKKYYIEKFNPTHNHQQKAYIWANISWRSKILIAQLRTNSHQLRCETRHWKRPKEMWEERVCILCSSRKVETKKHFILECEALKDSRENYVGIMAASSWDNLFSKEFVETLGAVIVKLHRKRAKYKNQWKNNLSHRLFFSLVDVKNTYFLSFPNLFFSLVDVKNTYFLSFPKFFWSFPRTVSQQSL
jgi:hypothetical protein